MPKWSRRFNSWRSGASCRCQRIDAEVAINGDPTKSPRRVAIYGDLAEHRTIIGDLPD